MLIEIQIKDVIQNGKAACNLNIFFSCLYNIYEAFNTLSLLHKGISILAN
jgi:hypothetical protein